MKLFSKTWRNDYAWLKLAMKSVLKLSTEPIDWTIVGDEGSKDDLEKIVLQALQETKFSESKGHGIFSYKTAEALKYWPEIASISNGYLAQQWVKMMAHRVMGNSQFWNWDSDVIAIKPFSSQTFMGKSGRPIHWFSQFNSLMNGSDRPAHEARIQMMREVFHMEHIAHEWMRCMPIPMHGEILSHAAQSPEWSRSFDMMKRGDHRFSEFNVIGQFAHLYFPDTFEWKNAESSGPTWSGGYVQGGVGSGQFQEHAIVAQGWSWGGIPQHIESFVNNL